MNTPTPQIHALVTRQIVAPDSDAANAAGQDTRDADVYRNPLWLIVIASTCLFAAMAALLALG